MSSTPQPTLTCLPLLHPSPTPPPEHFVHLIHNLLTPLECNTLISTHQNLIPSNVTTDTVRDREVFSCDPLASLLWSRLPFYHTSKIQDEDGQCWTAKCLNEKFRLCRYGIGGKFSPHTDARYLRSVDECSFMTVNIYLNSVPAEWNGATRILDEGVGGEVLGKVQPVLGMAAVFRDCLFHDGEELIGGEKYLLRTDIIYARDVPFDFEHIYRGLDNERKGRKAIALAEGLEEAGHGEEAMKWYKRAFRLAPALERGDYEC